MIDVPRGKGRGTWARILIDTLGDSPRWSAMIRCPSCAKPLSLVNHTIAPDGQVSPSVGHPDIYPPCDWHVTPKLVGWVDEPAPAPLPFFTPCERCGAKARQLSGWGTWSGGAGLICPDCIKSRNAQVGVAA